MYSLFRTSGNFGRKKNEALPEKLKLKLREIVDLQQSCWFSLRGIHWTNSTGFLVEKFQNRTEEFFSGRNSRNVVFKIKSARKCFTRRGITSYATLNFKGSQWNSKRNELIFLHAGNFANFKVVKLKYSNVLYFYLL
jgi:hypothetical protein